MNFDTLPIELIWRIFDCLSSRDLFVSLSNVNRRLNIVTASYPRHRLNFNAIPKSHFDLICRYIRPRQVISLTLSDVKYTPGQIKLFFSIFNGIKQFINLQSFELHSFGWDSLLDSVLVDLNKLNCLSSLRLVVESSASVVGSTSHLDLMPRPDSRLFDDRFIMVLSNLRFLTLIYCTFKQLGMIFCEAKHLISLNIVLEPDNDSPMHDKFEKVPSPPLSLIRLAIEISYYTLSMAQMEQFLSKMVHLKHLKIKGTGNKDLVNGLKWQPLVSDLTTFNFDFTISSEIDNSLLDTFCSAFWLLEKRWIFVFDKQQSRLFTVPLFTSQKINFPWPTTFYHSSASNIEQIVAEHVEKLSIQDSTASPTHCYQRVKSLRLYCSNISFGTLPLIVNLSTVEHLWIANRIVSLSNVVGHLTILMPRLHRLTIDDADLLLYIHPKPIFKQIRTLKLTYKNSRIMTASPIDVPNLCRLFSNVEHLTMRINSFEDMTSIIDGLKHLSSVTFDMKYFCNISSLIDLTEEWFLSNTRLQRMLNKNNYTYRYTSDCGISLWMS